MARKTTGFLDTLGRPMRDLRISVTDKCNFRCHYCMPSEIFGEKYEFLPRADLLTFEEVARLTRIFVNLGVEKVRLTGGEPLVRKNLEHLVTLIVLIDGITDVTLTTNGYLLAQHARALKDAGLQRVSVSLDSLDEQVFKKMNGRGYSPKRVLDGIRAADAAGIGPIKVNAVVQRGVNDHTIIELAKHFKGTGHIVRFIEYMDVGNLNGWKLDQVVPADEIVAMIDSQLPLKPIDGNYKGEVALRYSYLDGTGEIGVIASVTKPFCGECTRARLSTDGKLYTCLFAEQGTDLRGPMRDNASDDDLKNLVTGIWKQRQDRYSALRSRLTHQEHSTKKVEMYQIGG